jgi:hypothetical protein
MGQKIKKRKKIMKRLKIKILKEVTINETLPAVEKELPNLKDKTLIVLAGDSIAVGLSYHALGLIGAKKGNKKHIDSIPGFAAVLGGQRASWVDRNLKLDSYNSHPGKKILIVIAGTNDALNWSIGGKIKASSASASVDSIASKANSAGFDVTVMKLHEYTGPRTDLDLDKHKNFVKEFNSAVESHTTFDMVTPTSDGVHAPFNSTANTELLNRALSSLQVKKKDLVVPKEVNFRRGLENKMQKSTNSTHQGKVAKKGECYVHPSCNSIDGSVYGQITIQTAQQALNDVGIEVEKTGISDNQTKQAIMKFQKQQQGVFKPSDREFLRCDACIGRNTLEALRAALESTGKKLKTPTASQLKGAKISVKSRRPIKMQKASGAPETNTTRSYSGKLYASYTVDVLYQIAARWAPQSASEQDIRYMAAIGMAESGGIPSVLRDYSRHRDLSYGIWQINMLGKMGPYRRSRYGLDNNELLKNPNINCQVAWDLWASRSGSGLRKFRDWSVTDSSKSSGRGWRRFLMHLSDLQSNLNNKAQEE